MLPAAELRAPGSPPPPHLDGLGVVVHLRPRKLTLPASIAEPAARGSLRRPLRSPPSPALWSKFRAPFRTVPDLPSRHMLCQDQATDRIHRLRDGNEKRRPFAAVAFRALANATPCTSCTAMRHTVPLARRNARRQTLYFHKGNPWYCRSPDAFHEALPEVVEMCEKCESCQDLPLSAQPSCDRRHAAG